MTFTKRSAAPDLPTIERRTMAIETVELRADGSGDLTFRGYASVTEHAYDVAGGPPYGFTETIARGAFAKTLAENPDVVFLINHDGLPLARTASGTLRLDEDNTGLRVEADLNPEDRDVQWILPKLERGDLTEMSFAFRVMRQEWDEDYIDRRITEVSLNRGDVSVVRFGANPATSGDIERHAEPPTPTPGVWSLDYARSVAAAS